MFKKTSILANKEPPKPTAWWEDGYDRDTAAGNLKNTGDVKFFSGYDSDGKDCIIETLKTDLHQLDGLFLNNKPSTFLLLNEPGKGNFQKNSSVTEYEVTESGFVKNRSFQVGDHAGYFSISNDDSILAIGILKEDTIQIYQLNTGELLVNVDGGRKNGFFGELHFLPDALNTSLLECRIVEMQKGRATQTLLRMWDLGFRPKREPTDSDSDSDADEEETKTWEKKFSGEITTKPCEDDILVSRAALNCIEWLESSRAKPLAVVKTGEKWTSKTVVSPNKSFVAVSHFGFCSIYDVKKRELLKKVKSPDDSSAMYPLTPISFLGTNDELLLLRINQERMIILCNWRHSDTDMVVLSNVGGTISDGSLKVSRDENFLVSIPFGFLEAYNFAHIKKLLNKKALRRLKLECVLLRELLIKERAIPVRGKFEEAPHSKILADTLGSLVSELFREVMSFL